MTPGLAPVMVWGEEISPIVSLASRDEFWMRLVKFAREMENLFKLLARNVVELLYLLVGARLSG